MSWGPQNISAKRKKSAAYSFGKMGYRFRHAHIAIIVGLKGLHPRDHHYEDGPNTRLGGKIKSAEVDKLPYILVGGGKYAEAGAVSVAHREQGDIRAVDLETFVNNLFEERCAAVIADCRKNRIGSCNK
ncbi:MAG: His/Gly/Thr/Pro-type tRNA ligase C-terminal domain-containing protein [Planctomycetota bacterium]